MGPVDYYREMPYVFAASDINLNISVKGIQSGVPQRAFDILASWWFFTLQLSAGASGTLFLWGRNGCV